MNQMRCFTREDEEGAMGTREKQATKAVFLKAPPRLSSWISFHGCWWRGERWIGREGWGRGNWIGGEGGRSKKEKEGKKPKKKQSPFPVPGRLLKKTKSSLVSLFFDANSCCSPLVACYRGCGRLPKAYGARSPPKAFEIGAS